MVDNLKVILSNQKEVLSKLEKEVADIEANDLVSENKNLKEELEKCKLVLDRKKSESLKLSEENKKLKAALYEQLYSEKIYILNTVAKRTDIYYKSNIEGEINRLLRFEISVKKRIDGMIDLLKSNRVNIQDDIYLKIEEVRKLLNAKVSLAREEIQRQTGAFTENRDQEFSKLKQEHLTEEEIRGRIKQNNIESLIGLNIINKLGVLLLIIGVIAAGQFTYFKLPDTLKSVFAFTIGTVFLIAGEILNRKKPNVFSLGITSGGVAILYASLALSYFRFGILDIYPALGLCVLITSGAFVLSLRYNSQTISTFALIGGYLPIFSIAGNKTMIYSAMVYFIILNIFVLVISVNRKWIVTAYIGFSLNVIGSLFVADNMLVGKPINNPFSKDNVITILYIVFAFLNYTLIPIVGSFKKKLGFKNPDIVLLALNTFISSLILYWAFYMIDLMDFTGLLAIVFAIVYLALGWFIEKYMATEKKARALFYITGLTFVVLVIPFQFGKAWLSLGWLVEGIALLTYGIYKDMKDFKRAGIIISSLCLIAFIIFDLVGYTDPLFTYKYLSITAGSIIVLIALIQKKNLVETSARFYKYASVINLWVFFIYLILSELRFYLYSVIDKTSFDIDYMIGAAIILVSFLFAYTLPRLRFLCDGVIKGLSFGIYGIALLGLFFLNFHSPVVGSLNTVPLPISIVGTIELILIGILSVLAVRDLILSLVMEKKLLIEWYPFLISLYFVVILTQNLIIQYNLEFNNAIISIIYLATAFAWITFGFIKRYVFIRRFGLGLSMLAVAKLFIIDLAFLSQGYRIVSYFIFGVVLIAISFVYQYFNKKIDSIGEVIPDDKKINN